MSKKTASENWKQLADKRAVQIEKLRVYVKVTLAQMIEAAGAENRRLIEENAKLKAELESLRTQVP